MRQRKPDKVLPGFMPQLFLGREDGVDLWFSAHGRQAYLLITNNRGVCFCFNGHKSLRALAKAILANTKP